MKLINVFTVVVLFFSSAAYTLEFDEVVDELIGLNEARISIAYSCRFYIKIYRYDKNGDCDKMVKISKKIVSLSKNYRGVINTGLTDQVEIKKIDKLIRIMRKSQSTVRETIAVMDAYFN